MTTIEQLSLFPQKQSFNRTDFEQEKYLNFRRKLALCVCEAFQELQEIELQPFDKTCRSTMLNCLVSNKVEDVCSDQAEFIRGISNTRRHLCILDDKYAIFFKKSPVVNSKTRQDDLIKNQLLNKHVLFLTYEVDEFWDKLLSIKFVYLSTPSVIEYTLDISEYITNQETSVKEQISIELPQIKLRADLVKSSDAKGA